MRAGILTQSEILNFWAAILKLRAGIFNLRAGILNLRPGILTQSEGRDTQPESMDTRSVGNITRLVQFINFRTFEKSQKRVGRGQEQIRTAVNTKQHRRLVCFRNESMTKRQCLGFL